jgi:hypothetical protein
MAYSQGGTIEANDYNTRAANVNAIWGVGAGSNGYGQSTTLSNVSVSSTVTATNWASMIARIDSMRNHQSGVTSGITQPSAGDTVTFLSTLDTQISNIVTNDLLFNNTRGTALPTALGNPVMSNATAWFTSATKEFSVTLTSTDTVRYFFNAGGILTFYLSITGAGLTAKATDWQSFLTNQIGTISLGSNYCSRSGTGGDNLTQNTGIGFHSLTTTYQTLFNIGSTSIAAGGYGNNYMTIEAKVGGTLYGANSNVVSFRAILYDAAADNFNDQVNGTLNLFAGYTPPSTTYLSNTWSTPGNGVTVTNTQS